MNLFVIESKIKTHAEINDTVDTGKKTDLIISEIMHTQIQERYLCQLACQH